MNRIMKVLLAGLIALAMLSCNGEVTNSSSPVLLVVTNTQILSLIDLDPATQNAACGQNVGTINMQVIPKSSAATGDFVQVRVTRYRVSYRRLDGGTMVPAPFVRPIDTLIGLNQSAGLSNFLIVDGDALTQAPFAALLPQNGGRDPETGRPVVKLEIIVEIFGSTLAGDNVSDSTSFPLEFCYGCGGCG